MEDEFTALIEGLGYQVLRKRNPRPGIDLVAEFVGRPILQIGGEALASIRLMRPPFSPEGRTAFSVKRGKFDQKDVQELLNDVEEAKASQDALLNSIKGSILVTNHTVTEDELDKLLNVGVYCWDIRRLIFYATKVKLVRELAAVNPLSERIQPSNNRRSHFTQIERISESGVFRVNILVFVDDHTIMLARDHTRDILKDVYESSIRPICSSTGFSAHVTVVIHALGLAQQELVDEAYLDYASEQSAHPNVTFSVEPRLRLFQYGAAPWAPFLRL